MSTPALIGIIAVLLCISSMFSASETAISSVNKIRLKHAAAQGNKKAARAIEVTDRFDKALTAILIGNNVVNILASSLATIVFTDLLGSGSVGISTAVMTILVLIFGEITPKSFAKSHAEQCTLFFATPLHILITLLSPVVWLFQKLADLTKSDDEQPSVTEDELKYIIDEIEEQGVLEEQEGELVRSALEFDEITVSEILIPRVNIIGIKRTASVEEIKRVFFQEMYSRLPVFDKTIDTITGLITSKDFFKMLDSGETDIGTIMQDVIYITERQHISETLRAMQKAKTHLAVVLDQYGGTDGIVTLEDIIEELVGEIYDENDEVISNFNPLSEDAFDISGELSVSDLLGRLDLPEDAIVSESVTVGGWMMELLGHIPTEGETVTHGRFRLTATNVQDQKLERIRLSLISSPKEED